MRTRLSLTLALTVLLSAPVLAGPRDEALRLTPNDHALVLVAQNLREHVHAIAESPFAAWLPNSKLGKQFPGGEILNQLREQAKPVLTALELTEDDLLDDIIGDAVVFAYTPPYANEKKAERSVILVRPRKMATLKRAIEKLNELQSNSQELKEVVTHKHEGAEYFERQKAEGGSDFYCIVDTVFAFSQSEEEIKGILDRDREAAKEKPPELAARLTKLNVADAAIVMLINPRRLDDEIALKVKNVKPEEQVLLTFLHETWRAAESLAIYLSLDRAAEFGVAVQFNSDRLPAFARSLLTGERTASELWSVIPTNALFAAAGRANTRDLLDLLGSLRTDEDTPSLRASIEGFLGPLVGKDKLPHVLDSLGPDWGIWMLPPAAETSVPVLVGAIKLQSETEKGAESAKALVQAVDFGFQSLRVAYNSTHKEQLELHELKAGDIVIKSLTGGSLPAGVSPSFAMKGGYLLIASSPEAIRAFQQPKLPSKPGGDVLLARWNANSTRSYLNTHAPALAKLVASSGAGDEQTVAEHLSSLMVVLEPLETVELITNGNPNGMKLFVRVKTVKPLKK